MLALRRIGSGHFVKLVKYSLAGSSLAPVVLADKSSAIADIEMPYDQRPHPVGYLL